MLRTRKERCGIGKTSVALLSNRSVPHSPQATRTLLPAVPSQGVKILENRRGTATPTRLRQGAREPSGSVSPLVDPDGSAALCASFATMR